MSNCLPPNRINSQKLFANCNELDRQAGSAQQWTRLGQISARNRPATSSVLKQSHASDGWFHALHAQQGWQCGHLLWPSQGKRAWANMPKLDGQKCGSQARSPVANSVGKQLLLLCAVLCAANCQLHSVQLGTSFPSAFAREAWPSPAPRFEWFLTIQNLSLESYPGT